MTPKGLDLAYEVIAVGGVTGTERTWCGIEKQLLVRVVIALSSVSAAVDVMK